MNEWIIFWIDIYHFWWKVPFFLYILDTFWAIFGRLSYSTSTNDSLTIELNYLLNWISIIFLNWIIFWIESWVNQYRIEYWINHFLAKSKHWIESDRVLNTPTSSKEVILAKTCCSYGYCSFGEVMVTQPQFVAFRGSFIMAQRLFLVDNAFTAHLERFFSWKGHLAVSASSS